MLASQLSEPPGVLDRTRIRERRFDFARSRERFRESIAETQLSFLSYFWRNRSTRPAVSINFCLPVKNGWHWLQMSVWISDAVERVWKVLPHAHLTVAVWYSGWMPTFTGLAPRYVALRSWRGAGVHFT